MLGGSFKDPLKNPLRRRQPGDPWEDADDRELAEFYRLARTAVVRTGELANPGLYAGARQRKAAEWYAAAHPELPNAYMSAYKRIERTLLEIDS